MQDPNDLKEVTMIMERLLRRLLTTILKRMFEIRKEKKVNIYEFILTFKHSLLDRGQCSPS